MVELMPSTQRSIFRTGEFRQRVEEESVYNQPQQVGKPDHDYGRDVVGRVCGDAHLYRVPNSVGTPGCCVEPTNNSETGVLGGDILGVTRLR
jgi:hypothetical protein